MRYTFLLIALVLFTCKQPLETQRPQFEKLFFERDGGGAKSFYVTKTQSFDTLRILVVGYGGVDTNVDFEIHITDTTDTLFAALDSLLNGNIVIDGDFTQPLVPTGTWAHFYAVTNDTLKHEITNATLRNRLEGLESIVDARMTRPKDNPLVGTWTGTLNSGMLILNIYLEFKDNTTVYSCFDTTTNFASKDTSTYKIEGEFLIFGGYAIRPTRYRIDADTLFFLRTDIYWGNNTTLKGTWTNQNYEYVYGDSTVYMVDIETNTQSVTSFYRTVDDTIKYFDQAGILYYQGLYLVDNGFLYGGGTEVVVRLHRR